MICISEFEITPSCSATLEQASRKERFAKGVILANFGRFSFIERRSHLSRGGRLTGAERSRERKPFQMLFPSLPGFHRNGRVHQERSNTHLVCFLTRPDHARVCSWIGFLSDLVFNNLLNTPFKKVDLLVSPNNSINQLIEILHLLGGK